MKFCFHCVCRLDGLLVKDIAKNFRRVHHNDMVNIVSITLQDNLINICSELDKAKWETLEESASLEDLSHFLSSELNHLLLAYANDQVIAMLTAHELRKLDARKAEFLLYEMEVKSTFRRRGVGKMMIEKLLQIAKGKGAYEVWVLTDEENQTANCLYATLCHKKSNQIMYSLCPRNQ